MHTILVSILCVGCALAGTVIREKRQALNCQEPVVANVCTQSAGRVYFPHPTDNTKFLQCSNGGRMFIIKCPKGEVYDRTTTACTMQVTNPVVTNPTNPCTAQNIAAGNIFFAYASDKTKFIECNSQGQPIVLSCPTRLVYDTARQSCVLPVGTIVNAGTTRSPIIIGGGTGVVVGTGTASNPCTAQAVQSNNLFFPHPDPTKFIQCDLVGDAYVMQCPAGLVWSQMTSNCQSPYTAAQLNGGTGISVGK